MGAHRNMGFPFNISATAGASEFKFGAQLGFAKAHHKFTPRGKVGVALGSASSSKFWGSPIIFLQRLGQTTSNLARSWGLPRPIIKSHAQLLKLTTSNLVPGLGLPSLTIKPHPEEKWPLPWVREAPIYLGFCFNISAMAALSS